MKKPNNDLRLSAEVEKTNHPVWGKPYSNGKIKTFFIPSVHFGREIVELIQRMDADHENVTIDRISSLNVWGFGDFYARGRGAIGDFGVLYKQLEEVLVSDEDFDVLVIPSINGWDCFTDKSREAILRRVEAGAGLVMIQPFAKESENSGLFNGFSPLKPLYEGGVTDTEERLPLLDKMLKDKWVSKSHYITDGVPFVSFPYDEMGFFPYEADGEVILESESGKPVAAVKEYGKGRVVAFGYYARDILPQHSDFTGWDPCYEPVVANWNGAEHHCSFQYLEYFYSLINRSIIWAAGKEPQNRITNVSFTEDKLSIKTAASASSSTFSYKIKDLYDNLVLKGSTRTGEINLPEWLKLGGSFRADVYSLKDSKIEDWATAVIEYPLASRVISLDTDKLVAKPGENIIATVVCEGECTLIINVLDDYNRVLCLEKYDITSNQKVQYEYTTKQSKSMHIRFQALVFVSGHLIQIVHSEKIIITSLDRDFHDFEVFICPQNRGQGDLSPLENQQLIRMGNTGLYVGDNKLSTLSGAEGLGFSFYERMPYVENKENYVKTHDKKYLHRLSCLNGRKFWEENDERIEKAVSNNAKYGPVSYFANDEGSMTCYTDEMDICFCPECMKEMQKWLKGEYNDIDHLNSVWGTNYKAWKEAIPNTLLEAEKSGNFASWGDHRRFMELTFANAYGHIRDSIRKIDPIGKVRLSGTQTSTPYSGFDYYQLHQVVGYFEAYSGGNQFEIHRSYANEGTVIGRWAGYGAVGITAANGIWTALYHDLTLISIFWEYSILNPDYTYSRSAIDYSNVFKEIKREGIGKLLLYSAKRDNLGIALHQSMTSIHGAYTKRDLPRYDDDRKGWITILEDMGYQYNIMASQQIESGKLIKDKYKLLILPYAISLSDKEVSEIKDFVNKGGIVLGDFQTGIMDQHCYEYDKGRIDDIFGIERYSNNTRKFYINNELKSTKDFPYFENINIYGSPDFEFIESDTRVTTGKAAYVQDFSRTVPAIVVNKFGEGAGIYLNFSLDKYGFMKKFNTGGSDMREIIKTLLTFAGIQKFAEIRSKSGELIDNGYETIYYSDNNAKYVAVLKDLKDNRRVGHDGLAIGNVDADSIMEEPVTIQLPAKSHVYDVRKKKYLGYIDRVDEVIPNGDTALLSLLPHQVNDLKICMDKKVSRGSKIDIELQIVSDRDDDEYANVLAINFYSPTGEYEWIYSENVSVRAKSHVKSIEVPFNEKAGTWKISVKDVATGVSEVAEFEIV